MIQSESLYHSSSAQAFWSIETTRSSRQDSREPARDAQWQYKECFMMRFFIVLLLCGLCAMSGCGGKATSSETTEILVGEFGSMTGTTAAFGISARNGIEMAIDEVNGSGGILGKRGRVVTEDDQGKAEEAQTVGTKLVNQNRVVAVLGEVASSRTLAAAPVCQANGIPMITPSSTNPKVTLIGDYIFRVCFIDSFQGLVMAKFA